MIAGFLVRNDLNLSTKFVRLSPDHRTDAINGGLIVGRRLSFN
jgi:hypothetical protein